MRKKMSTTEAEKYFHHMNRYTNKEMNQYHRHKMLKKLIYIIFSDKI